VISGFLGTYPSMGFKIYLHGLAFSFGRPLKD